VPNVMKIWGLNLPGTPWATSACCGMTFTLLRYWDSNIGHNGNELIDEFR